MSAPLDLMIIGAGPAGLAAAIAAGQAGFSYKVLEKGVLVNSIFHFPRNMVFFTTPELLEIGGLPFVTPYEKPTRAEALRYYRRVADTYRIPICFGETVGLIARVPPQAGEAACFEIGSGIAGRGPSLHRARHVILCTGYYDHPNRLGIPGEGLPHVHHYYSEPHGSYRKTAVVVGGKNSAAIAALELYRAGAAVTLVHRRDRLSDSIKYWIRPDIENRIREGSIRACFDTRLVEILPESVVADRNGTTEEIRADDVFLLTGYHPDTSLMARSGIAVHPETQAPDHDPKTLETNVPGLFVAGSVVSGKETDRVFIENGKFHGEIIVSTILARR